MPLTAGELDRRIVIQRDTPTQDGHGNDVDGWADLSTRWARVIYGSGMERRQAAQADASQTATFEVRRDSVTAAVTPADRILFDGLVWEIAGAVRLGRDGMAFTAIARQPGGGA